MQPRESKLVIDLPTGLLSDETKKWIAEQLNRRHQENFSYRDIIKMPKENGQFELYALKRTIAKGSYSEIYKAYCLSFDGKIRIDSIKGAVAIKGILKSEENKEERAEAVEGLKRESRALKLLNRKGDYVSTREGDYLVMPLYRGEKLGQEAIIEKAPKLVMPEMLNNASLENKLDLMLQLGMQVQVFHDNHFLHGDLHPSNILVAQKGDALSLRVIDFDQNCLINNKEEIVPQENIKMAIGIKAPEVRQKKIGAASDIYALALNFLYILGHENPFTPAPDKAFIRDKRLEYEDSNEFKTALANYQDPKIPDLYKRTRIFNQKFPPEKLEELYLKERGPLKMGDLSALQVEIDGIPVRLIVKNYIENMLNDSPEKRPTIDEVNAFMRGIIHLVNNQKFFDNSAAVLAKWEGELAKDPNALSSYTNTILAYGKPQIVEQKVEDKKVEDKKVEDKKVEDKKVEDKKVEDKKEMGTTSDLGEREKIRMQLAVLLTGMREIDNEINQKKGFIGRSLHSKSKERKQFEANLKGIAGMFDAKSSADPARDYALVMRFLEKEKEREILVAGKSFIGSDKFTALDAIILKAKLASDTSSKDVVTSDVLVRRNSR